MVFAQDAKMHRLNDYLDYSVNNSELAVVQGIVTFVISIKWLQLNSFQINLPPVISYFFYN